ncbi:hypothetical protein HELRODRAFT_107112 [Helobdella robusta]|uniref:Uncharacterized protein n=1 Tax=Helobdella robusta TaxID=6412 RepID=T1EE76_HELRO|nr:hypothetical protein HELRODRAFT_107112 [Helobdella robusta]ESN98997.1 hypothetical protein HELRODRAFT_107112 [Helobdella robusta]
MWVITPEEKAKNDNQFYMMNPVAGYLTGEQVKSFFLQSGLPQPVLGKIWSLSDLTSDGKMDKREFSIAMHLIKKALLGFEIPHVLPPNFLTDVAAGSVFNPGIMNANMVGGLSATPTLPSSSSSGEWIITPGQRLRYKQMFNNHDSQHKGYLTGLEAKSLLSQSGLTHTILAQIWCLADIDTDGNLSPDEFCVAMYLIDQAKSGFPVPATLPVDLVPPSYRRTRRMSENVHLPQVSSMPGLSSSAGRLFQLSKLITRETSLTKWLLVFNFHSLI